MSLSKLGSTASCAQVTPGLLTQALLELTPEANVVKARPIELVRSSSGALSAVRYSGDGIDGGAKDGVLERTTDVVLANGPWLGALATELLGDTLGRQLDVDGQKAHSVVIKVSDAARELITPRASLSSACPPPPDRSSTAVRRLTLHRPSSRLANPQTPSSPRSRSPLASHTTRSATRAPMGPSTSAARPPLPRSPHSLPTSSPTTAPWQNSSSTPRPSRRCSRRSEGGRSSLARRASCRRPRGEGRSSARSRAQRASGSAVGSAAGASRSVRSPRPAFALSLLPKADAEPLPLAPLPPPPIGPGTGKLLAEGILEGRMHSADVRRLAP